MATYTDDFTYADGLLSNQTNWAAPFETSLSVVSNNLRAPTTSVEHYNVFQTAIAADSFCEVVGHFGNTSEYGEFNCFVRCNNSTETFYRADYNTANGSGEVTLYRVVNGGYTNLRSVAGLGVDTNNHTLRIEAVTMASTAVRLRVWWDSELLIDFSDVNAARLTTGSYVGVGIYRTTTLSPEIVSWSAGDATTLHTYWQDFTGLSNQALSAVTDWTTRQISGSGVMSIDTGHASAYSPSVDFSSEGEQFAIYGQALDSDHHYAEADVMVDYPNQSAGNSNDMGVLVRGDAATASATSDGYVLYLRQVAQGGALTLRLGRITDGAHVFLQATADLTGTFAKGEEVVHRVRLEANGNWLFGYLDGVLLLTRDITSDSPSYTTGTYCGTYARRGEGSVPSQPWWDNWAAGDLPIRYVARALLDGLERTNSTISKPTGTAEGDLMIATITDYGSAGATYTPPSGWTKIGDFDDPSGNQGTYQEVWRKVAGASEPTDYTFNHAFSYTHGSITTFRPNTGYTWPTNPIESTQDWGANVDGNPIQQPGATTTAVMAMALGLCSGFSAFTPGDNTLAGWQRIGGTDTNWHGSFIRQFDAATAYANVSHGESETLYSGIATTLVVYAEAASGPTYDETGRSVTVTESDSVTDEQNYVQSLSVTATESDSVTDKQNYVQSLSVTATITDSVTALITYPTENLSVTATFSDSVTDTVSLAESLSVTVTASDSVADTQNYVENLSATITTSDSVADVGTFVESLSVTATVTDSVNDVYTPATGYDETGRSVTFTVTDSVADSVSNTYPITDYIVQYRQVGGDWVTFDDGVSASTGATVTGLSNGTSYEFRVGAVNANGQGQWSNISGPCTPTTGSTYSESLSATITASDSVADTQNYTESLSVTITTTDVVADDRHLAESLSVTVVITDAVADTAALVESLSVTVVITDTVTDATDTTESLSATATFSDSVAELQGYADSLSASIATTDAVTDSQTYADSLSVTATFTDAVAAAAAYAQSLSVTATFSDSVTDDYSSAMQEPLSDSFTITDSVTDARHLTESLSDSVTITDAVTDVIPVAFYESLHANIVPNVWVSDLLSAIDSLSDSITFTDAVADDRHLTESVSDSATISVTVDELHGFYESAVDTVTVSDSVQAVAAYTDSLSDSTLVTDSGTDFQTFVGSTGTATLTTSDVVREVYRYRRYVPAIRARGRRGMMLVRPRFYDGERWDSN